MKENCTEVLSTPVPQMAVTGMFAVVFLLSLQASNHICGARRRRTAGSARRQPDPGGMLGQPCWLSPRELCGRCGLGRAAERETADCTPHCHYHMLHLTTHSTLNRDL